MTCPPPPPSGNPTPITAKAIVLSGSSGKVVATIPNAAGIAIAAPRPAKARTMQSAILTRRKPEIKEKIHIVERPMRKRYFRPYRSAKRPATRRPLERISAEPDLASRQPTTRLRGYMLTLPVHW